MYSFVSTHCPAQRFCNFAGLAPDNVSGFTVAQVGCTMPVGKRSPCFAKPRTATKRLNTPVWARSLKGLAQRLNILNKQIKTD